MKHKLSKSFKKILGAEQQTEKHDFKNENTTESLGKDPNKYQEGKHQFSERVLKLLDKTI